MAKVTMHKAADGSLHQSHRDCVKHDVKLRIIAGIGQADLSLNSFVADDRGNEVIYPETISAFVSDNADQLRNILNNALIARRARKPKAAKVATA